MSLIDPGSAILVTGATGGIGSEIAAQAAEAGAVVGLHGARPERVAAAAAGLRARAPGARLVSAPGDFRTADGVESVVERFAAEAGRLDAVIHCAITGAPGVSGLFAGTDPAAYARHLEYTLGVFQRLAFAAYPHLKAQGGGTILGFMSDAGRFAAPRQSLIGAAFGAIAVFVRNLSVEAARDGVRVHAISPSYVADTPVFERVATAGRAATAAARAGLGLPTPKDIAPLCLFLCGPGAAKITGQVISINGGLNA